MSPKKKVSKKQPEPTTKLDIFISKLRCDRAKDIASIIIDKHPVKDEDISWNDGLEFVIGEHTIQLVEWTIIEDEPFPPIDSKKLRVYMNKLNSIIIQAIVRHIITEYPDMNVVWNGFLNTLYIDGSGVLVMIYENNKS